MRKNHETDTVKRHPKIIKVKQPGLSLPRQDDCIIVREPVIGLIKWLRPKGLKVCSYVEKCAEFKNQTLKNIGWYTKVLCAMEYSLGMQYLKIALKWGYPCRYILKTMLY